MKAKRISLKGITLLLLVVVSNGCQNQDKSFTRNIKHSNLIGKEFVNAGLLDTASNAHVLDFSKYDFTIVDFWFSTCTGCVIDMNRLNTIISREKGKFQVVSLSINSFDHWKALFTSKNEIYRFLKKKHLSWSHYVLKSLADPRLKNDVPMDNINFVELNYQTRAFPLYLVVDQKGKIVEVPTSAAEYLESTR